MPQPLLGKRLRSHGRVSSPLPCSTTKATPRKTRRSLPSPDPTPNPKRIRLSASELGHDDSNKENIPPLPVSPSSTIGDVIVVTSRAQRASRRASMQAARPETPRRRVSLPAVAPVPPSPVSPPSVSTSKEVETPTKTFARLSLASPPATPESATPLSITQQDLSSEAQPIHALARPLLYPQSHDDLPLVGREIERADIQAFLDAFLTGRKNQDEATSLYISGAPGTGKTALVHDILKTLEQDPSLRALYVNCVSLGSQDGLAGIWKYCANELGVSKTSRGGMAKVDWTKEFGRLVEGQKCIIVLDEIDHITASLTSISDVFTISSAPQTCTNLRIIGISNMHTLTDSKVSACTRTLHFEPYTAAQMKTILTTRLSSLPSDDASPKVFPLPTIAFLTMKVASQTGDIRTLFSVARRALDLAVMSASSLSNSRALPVVSPAHVLSAFKTTQAAISNTSKGSQNGTEIITRIRNLGLQHRFALMALLLATKRVLAGLSLSRSTSLNQSKTDGTDISDNAPTLDATTLHGFYSMTLTRGANAVFPAVNRTEFADLLNILDGNGLIHISTARGKAKLKNSAQLIAIASGIREEELVRGLTGSQGAEAPAPIDVQEEEVRLIWQREIARLEREKNAMISTTRVKADIEGATED